MANKQVIIVGGGAAGMMAAIAARRQGAAVTILERNPRIGKKLLVTGNGRCNFTNIYADSACYYCQNPGFAAAAFARQDVPATIAFFEELGIAHKVEDLGKVFPMSDQASSVLDVLLYELNQCGVLVICDAQVTGITPKRQGFTLSTAAGSQYFADSVILAAGGKAMPSTGSDGNGFALAERLGHSVIEPFPGLVQLKLEGSFFKQIEGVKFVGTAELLSGRQSIAKDKGDILFGNYGVSGPPILQISRQAGQLLRNNQPASLKLTLFDMSQEAMDALLAARLAQAGAKTIEFSLVGLVNKRLIPVLLKQAGISDSRRPAAELSRREREKLSGILTDWRLPITGTKGWTSAQVTAGGVDTAEINPETLESRRVKGLYFAGEILDIDGQCGGFNLQWAWSSGCVAGQHAAL